MPPAAGATPCGAFVGEGTRARTGSRARAGAIPRPSRSELTEAYRLEEQLQPQLDDARVAGAAAHSAVEVEGELSRLRAQEVLFVEDVEDLEHRLHGDAAEREVLRQPEVERGELVVLAPEVAARHRAVRIDAG